MTNNEELQLGAETHLHSDTGKIGKRITVVEGVDKDLNSPAGHQVRSVIGDLGNENHEIDISQRLMIPFMEVR